MLLFRFLMKKAPKLLQLDEDKVELFLSQSNASLISVLELQLNNIAWFPAFIVRPLRYRGLTDRKRPLICDSSSLCMNWVFRDFAQIRIRNLILVLIMLSLKNKGKSFPENHIHKAYVNYCRVFSLCLFCIINQTRFYCEASLIICILQRQHNWKANELHHWLCKRFAFWNYWQGGTE